MWTVHIYHTKKSLSPSGEKCHTNLSSVLSIGSLFTTFIYLRIDFEPCSLSVAVLPGDDGRALTEICVCVLYNTNI